VTDNPQPKGLYGKYRVERVDGRGIALGCFVLEFDDPKAWDALLTYAETCEAWGNPAVAADLRKRVLAIQSASEHEERMQ
jgi:hypothetical protein